MFSKDLNPASAVRTNGFFRKQQPAVQFDIRLRFGMIQFDQVLYSPIGIRIVVLTENIV